ncbi:thioesterase family protein [Chitinimonas viridis]|uniref:Thioesterase family protein n=2 Tax=Chitinimonas TaxID=240411 RepID=A0ABT8B7G4_9NEIS|nr:MULTISPECIES: thioesterase family protein [Chitinimonas]MDN3578088.1 thioesterase family protein [Chitinimonas viridis]GLR11968.1 thioesterase [Chitinimonas prasina]
MTTPTLLATEVFPMRWGDMDALGHLNNTLYFRFCEEARVRWLDQRGWGVRLDAGDGPILAATSCQFKVPLVYPCNIRLEIYLKKLGNSSFTLGHRIMRDDAPDQIAAEAEAVIVWCDYAAGTAKPLPEALRQQLEGAAV